MPWLEIGILAAIAAWLAIALLWMRRRRKKGCSGCCEHCAQACKRPTQP